ncbi:ABC transporter permease [Nocardioides sp. zg-ZUI104]|uniref:ABC transporter permease n=1 Tax=Nocardioides faecalis TaxID=2803858 RepID=UPI001BCF23DC|nr:ABC transporter permease [Nocardioides faecalis]MBS4754550.1 ABC transporter permease [Nocardioides faecalis]
MFKFVMVKVAGAALTLYLAATIAFVLSRTSGNPVHQILGDHATDDQIAALRERLGLDASLPVQYFSFLGDLITGDFGTSLRYGQENLTLIGSRLGASILLAALALALGAFVGFILGIVAALHENGWIDRLSMGLALLGQSVPAFWLGMMLVVLFSIKASILPAGEFSGPSSLILPVVTLSTLPMAKVARLARSSMVEILEEPFVEAARARGFSGRRVLFAHVVRSSLTPVVTLTGIQAGALLSGAVTVEYVFAWPGLGSLAVQAVGFRDFPLVQALVVFGACAFVIINLSVDLINGAIDPRLRETV